MNEKACGEDRKRTSSFRVSAFSIRDSEGEGGSDYTPSEGSAGLPAPPVGRLPRPRAVDFPPLSWVIDFCFTRLDHPLSHGMLRKDLSDIVFDYVSLTLFNLIDIENK